MNDTARRLLDIARRRGARAADVWIKTGEMRRVCLDPTGGVDWTTTAEGGIGLRVFQEGTWGFASICGVHPDEDHQRRLVMAAIDATMRSFAEQRARQPSLPSGPPADGRGMGIFDPRLHTCTAMDLEGSLDEAATEALGVDPRVRRLDTAVITASSSDVHLHNTEGFEGTYKQTWIHLSLGVVAEEGSRRFVVRQSRTARSLSAFSPALFGDQTARLAATALEGGPPDTGRVPAVLSPQASVEVLRLFARMLTTVERKPASRVAATSLTIIDDGHLPGGVATAPFDGEGTPTRRTRIVERGRFGETIHDRQSAALVGPEVSSTGNGLRVSFRDPPHRMTSNLFIAPGSEEPGELVASIDDGIWIQSMRPTTAVHHDGREIVAIGFGRWIKNGRPDRAVVGVTIVAGLDDLLHGVSGIGNDLTFGFPGPSFGAPSLLVKEVSVGA